jgi:hypothetical protein
MPNNKRVYSLDLDDMDKRIEFEWNIEDSGDKEESKLIDDT